MRKKKSLHCIKVIQKKFPMKKLKLLSAIILVPLLSTAQNLPQCDSLVILCCDFISGGPNTLTIQVSNPTSVLFDYPGFALFNSTMDTIALETVTYFGISTGPQTHTMNIIMPLILPYAGYLNLYIGFYDSLACSFAFTIADTTASVNSNEHDNGGLNIFPNPAQNELSISIVGFSEEKILSLVIFDVLGNKIYDLPFEFSPMKLTMNGIAPGIYFLAVSDAMSAFRSVNKFTISGN